jgi:nitroreductase
MTLVFPDPDSVRRVLTLATQAPSMHNSQPWRWLVAADSLALFADPSRHLPHADPDRRDLLVSCGASLHHCTVALAALGWQSKVHRIPDPSNRHHLATITVSPQPAGELDVALAGAITRRRTDRRTYSSWPVPWGYIALMGARAARAGVMLRQIEPLPRLNTLLAEAASTHSQDPDYVRELSAWSGRRGSVAGVPSSNAPGPLPGAPVAARTFARPELAQPDASPPGDDNGVVVALGTQFDDDLARLRAGEAASLVLLSATALGLATCPVTEPLEIPATRETLRADVFGTSGYPQILMRFGWAPADAALLPATPRRPLMDVTDWATGPRGLKHCG